MVCIKLIIFKEKVHIFTDNMKGNELLSPSSPLKPLAMPLMYLL
jgi:hypothetical protein